MQQICTAVLSPWFNDYNFPVENVSRLERASGEPFLFEQQQQQPEMESLVKFVLAEMEACRLYTVLPRLLRFIDLLCNTYVRMSGTQLQGQLGEADARGSTQAPFHVLLISSVDSSLATSSK